MQRNGLTVRAGLLAALLAATLHFAVLGAALARGFAAPADTSVIHLCGEGQHPGGHHAPACCLSHVCLLHALPGFTAPPAPLALPAPTASVAVDLAWLHSLPQTRPRRHQAALPRGPPLI